MREESYAQYEQEKAWGEEQAYLASESAAAQADDEAIAAEEAQREQEREKIINWQGLCESGQGACPED